MAKIEFKAKARTIGGRAYVAVPKLGRQHCDMPAFRRHPRWGFYANSELFPGMLAGIRREVFGHAHGGIVWLDAPPPGVTVRPGFLVKVEFEV